jgi:hypothetical protein
MGGEIGDLLAAGTQMNHPGGKNEPFLTCRYLEIRQIAVMGLGIAIFALSYTFSTA